MDIVVNSNSLKLNWKDNSGCASQMTSLNLKVLQDGLASSERTNNTYRIPRSCLKQDRNEVNVFSMMLPTNPHSCSIEWKPLDKCRKYTFDMSSQYTATWNGSSTFLDIFTKGNEANFTIFPNDGMNPWRCPRKHFSCNHWGCSYAEESFICNGGNDCVNGRDEQYCDQSVCKDGFKCGRQCIPKELVCNGQLDCLDGSDENYSCIYANMCQHLTDSSGNFSSQLVPRPADDIHWERTFDATLKTTVLISVQPNQQIWLTFKKCFTLEHQHFVNIYDGPYSTSPLLLSTSGLVTNPFSVRSSSNELYVEFPSYYQADYGISAFYTSVNSTNEPFVPGCGGYIYGDGVIPIPNYVANNTDISDCFWFIEATTNGDTILLTNSKSASSFQAKVPFVLNNPDMVTYDEYDNESTALLSPPENLLSIVVYDGWSTSGHVLHDRKHSMTKIAMYSISNKMLVHFKPPKVVKENVAFSWNVSKISTPECKYDLNGANGIIKSPNYPVQVYPDLTDCRWNITVKAGSKVRLLFAYFETQAGMDFLYVYDGPSVYSKLLFEKSGLITTPFEVNSTTNQVLVRFTSDDTSDASYPGFLAVYSTV
ncbi:enteropeptidase-like [Daphnia pulex]|uniref:enteropeptidase-like n=1 Tax=Daphnia pulex TaxID=6669 RepID=UPI001EDE3669|nr:enteropeptidase-like [Daphnia pulex]